jgi:hypothetical protein
MASAHSRKAEGSPLGSEAIWVPLVLSAVSAGAAYVNQRNVAHRQDNQLAAQLRAQADKQHQADAKTAALIQSQQQSSDKDEKAHSLAGFQQAIAQKSGAATAPLTSLGAVSDAYEKSKSNAALGIADKANNFADNVSSIDAPTQQRQNDALTMGRYGTDVNQIRRFNQGDDFLANMRLRGIKANPLLSLVSGVAGGAAGAASAGGYGADDYGAAANGDAYQPFNYKAPNLQNKLPDVWGYG